MIQEAILEVRESDRYIGFLVEEDIYDTTSGLVRQAGENRPYKWRVTDRLTGKLSEGPIPFEDEDDAARFFEHVWQQLSEASDGIPTGEEEPEVIGVPANPYADHPYFGRF